MRPNPKSPRAVPLPVASDRRFAWWIVEAAALLALLGFIVWPDPQREGDSLVAAVGPAAPVATRPPRVGAPLAADFPSPPGGEPAPERQAFSPAVVVSPPVVPHAGHPPVETGLPLPAAAVPPDPSRGLTAEQLATFSMINLDFIAATEGPPPGLPPNAAANDLRAQWLAARREADERFELFLGTEILGEQRNRTAAADQALR